MCVKRFLLEKQWDHAAVRGKEIPQWPIKGERDIERIGQIAETESLIGFHSKGGMACQLLVRVAHICGCVVGGRLQLGIEVWDEIEYIQDGVVER